MGHKLWGLDAESSSCLLLSAWLQAIGVGAAEAVPGFTPEDVYQQLREEQDFADPSVLQSFHTNVAEVAQDLHSSLSVHFWEPTSSGFLRNSNSHFLLLAGDGTWPARCF